MEQLSNVLTIWSSRVADCPQNKAISGETHKKDQMQFQELTYGYERYGSQKSHTVFKKVQKRLAKCHEDVQIPVQSKNNLFLRKHKMIALCSIAVIIFNFLTFVH